MYVDPYELAEASDCLSQHLTGTMHVKVRDVKTAGDYLVVTVTRPDSINDEVNLFIKNHKDGYLPIYKNNKLIHRDNLIIDDEVYLIYKHLSLGVDHEGFIQIYVQLIDDTMFHVPWISLEKWQLNVIEENK